MADQTVAIENPDGKYRVAYDMALRIFFDSGNKLSSDTKDEFLNLVQECIQSLNGSVRRQRG